MSQRAGTNRSGCSTVAKVDFRLNLAGLNELMKSGEMQSVLDSAASQILDFAKSNASPNIKGAAEGYAMESAHPIKFVAVAAVKATNFEARLDNSKHNTLEKAKASVKI